MSDHGSEEPENVEVEDEVAGHQVKTGLREILVGGPIVTVFAVNPGELKNWLASIGKGQFIYELSERETAYLAENAAEGIFPKFTGCHLAKGSQLT